MRKCGWICVVVFVVWGLGCGVPAAGEAPGDGLLDVFEQDLKPRESLVPEGVTIAEDFKPGRGDAIGTLAVVAGRVLAIHHNEKTAYLLAKGRPLFTADTLISGEKASAQIEFEDGSFITLGTYTKLVLDKSVYDPSAQKRDSFLKLLFGKARFIVKRLVDFRSSNYKVRTPTAVVGVRGSDFAVCVSRVNPLNTTLVTGPDTTVLFAGDVGAAQIIGPMQAATARAGGAATPGMNVTAYPPQPLATGGPLHGAASTSAGGLSQGTYWAIGGALAVGAGTAVVAADDDDSGSVLLTVTADPADGTPVDGTGIDIVFTFSKPINRVDQTNFVVTPVGIWEAGTPLIQDEKTVIVSVLPLTAVSEGFTIELVNITGTDGSSLLGQTSFSYPLI